MAVVSRRPATRAIQLQSNDRWNRWIFRSQFGGTGSGERSRSFANVNGSFNANRTTEQVKFNASVSGSFSESSFDLPGGEHYVAPSHRVGTTALWVYSLGRRWSTGVRAAFSTSTFQNLDRSSYIASALEYNVFPYSESTRRLLTLQYSVGLRSFDYDIETIFEKLSERRAAQLATVELTARQRWGTLGAGLDASTYLPDVRYSNVNGWFSVDLSIYRGLSLNLSGDLSSVRDQLSLPKGEATTEEILVRQRELPTSYQYSYTFGVAYTFGSIYSPVVNPRLRRGGF